MQPSFLRIAVGPIFALMFYALPLVSETASAETQSTEQEQAEKTAVDHALRDYNDAFGRDDLFAIGQHCNVPFVSISPEGGQGGAYKVRNRGPVRGVPPRPQRARLLT